MDGFQTRLTGLTPDEARCLFLVGQPQVAHRLGLGAPTRSARNKLLNAIAPALADSADDLSTWFVHDPDPWTGNRIPHGELRRLARSVQQRRTIELTLARNRGDGSTARRGAESRLVEFGLCGGRFDRRDLHRRSPGDPAHESAIHTAGGLRSHQVLERTRRRSRPGTPAEPLDCPEAPSLGPVRGRNTGNAVGIIPREQNRAPPDFQRHISLRARCCSYSYPRWRDWLCWARPDCHRRASSTRRSSKTSSPPSTHRRSWDRRWTTSTLQPSRRSLTRATDPELASTLTTQLEDDLIPAADADLVAVQRLHADDGTAEKQTIQQLATRWFAVRSLWNSMVVDPPAPAVGIERINTAFDKLNQISRSLVAREARDGHSEFVRSAGPYSSKRGGILFLLGAALVAALASVFWLYRGESPHPSLLRVRGQDRRRRLRRPSRGTRHRRSRGTRPFPR